MITRYYNGIKQYLDRRGLTILLHAVNLRARKKKPKKVNPDKTHVQLSYCIIFG